jgi:outer membrane protein assembly factor BamB
MHNESNGIVTTYCNLGRAAGLCLAGLFFPTFGLAAAGSAPAVPPEYAGSLLPVGSPEPGWPQWRGVWRDGISRETGLLQSWPEEGPPLVWVATGLGRGYSAPIITGGRIVLTGDEEDRLEIHALDLDGQRLWRTENGRSWKTPYPGARAAATYSEGRLYHLNAHGRLACLDAATGVEVWAFNVFERFGGRNLTWALSECLLVDGPRVIVTPGGTQALMAALDKQNGATIWTSEPLRLGPSPSPAHQRVAEPAGETDRASYSSPILVTLNGRRQIVQCSLRHAFGVDAESGRLLWTRPLPTRYQVIAATPVLVGDSILVTAPDTEDGGFLVRLTSQGDAIRAETVWRTMLDTCHGGVVKVGDALYGSWYRSNKGWACLDPATGEVRYSLHDLAKGSVLWADQRLYCLSETGEMALLEPTADSFRYAGRFRLVEGRVNDAWAHPVILDGRLYLRHHETLSCYDVRR